MFKKVLEWLEMRWLEYRLNRNVPVICDGEPVGGSWKAVRLPDYCIECRRDFSSSVVAGYMCAEGDLCTECATKAGLSPAPLYDNVPLTAQCVPK